jgi:hypothetical protein
LKTNTSARISIGNTTFRFYFLLCPPPVDPAHVDAFHHRSGSAAQPECVLHSCSFFRWPARLSSACYPSPSCFPLDVTIPTRFLCASPRVVPCVARVANRARHLGCYDSSRALGARPALRSRRDLTVHGLRDLATDENEPLRVHFDGLGIASCSDRSIRRAQATNVHPASRQLTARHLAVASATTLSC